MRRDIGDVVSIHTFESCGFPISQILKRLRTYRVGSNHMVSNLAAKHFQGLVPHPPPSPRGVIDLLRGSDIGEIERVLKIATCVLAPISNGVIRLIDPQRSKGNMSESFELDFLV